MKPFETKKMTQTPKNYLRALKYNKYIQIYRKFFLKNTSNIIYFLPRTLIIIFKKFQSNFHKIVFFIHFKHFKQLQNTLSLKK